jgi:hypothetical protein
MAWVQRLAAHIRLLGHEPDCHKKDVLEFWIENETMTLHSTMKMVWIFRFLADELQADYISYSDEFGFKSHSSWKVREYLHKGEAVYTFHFPYEDRNDNSHTNLSYLKLESKITEDIEGGYRIPRTAYSLPCDICKISRSDAFWTTCSDEGVCFACISKLSACPKCNQRGRAKRFRHKTL